MPATTIKRKMPTPKPIWLKSYPDYTKWNADIDVYPLYNLWEDSSKKYADLDLIAYMGSTYSYAEIDAEIQIMAGRLQKIGIKKGSHVGICMANTPWYPITYFAILKLGGVVVNFNPLYPEADLKHQIVDSEIELMVTLDLDALYAKLPPLLGNGKFKQIMACPFTTHLPAVKTVLFNIFKRSAKAKIQTSDTIHTFATIGDNLPVANTAKVSTDDLAVIQYTGGTTGVSKGAPLTHRNISANLSQCGHWFPSFDIGVERVSTFLPLFHVFAMTVCMCFSIRQGACMLMIPKFELGDALDMMKAEKGTMLVGVPTIFQAIINSPTEDRMKLTDLKIAMSGGAPLAEETKNVFESLTDVEVVEGYGLSECAPVACANPFNGESRAACIGFPIPQTEITLRDLENPNKTVKNGERGEVCIKGPQVMAGYWNRPDTDKDTFTKDGFFRTGDVAMFDENGFCYIVDRIKDLILCNGYNVYPRNIEEVILTHPDVLEVTVIGVPDAKRGEQPKAFIRLKDNVENPPSEDDMIAFAKPLLSPQERVTLIEYRDELPKTIIGKLSKKELREE